MNRILTDPYTKFIGSEQITNPLKLSLYGNIFDVYLAKLLVFHKNKFLRLKTNEIGDKMVIFRLFPLDLSSQLSEINLEYFLAGMSIYQQFDEDTGKNTVYLYKYPKHNISELNLILNKYFAHSTQIAIQHNFLILNGNTLSINEIYQKIINTNISISEVYSFLLGLILIYGNIHFEDNQLKSIKLHIPVYGQIELILKIFSHIFQIYLGQQSLILMQPTPTSNFLKIYQTILDDWEILENIIIYLKLLGYSNIINSKKMKMLNYQNIIQEYLLQINNNITNSAEFVNLLINGKLKFIIKN